MRSLRIFILLFPFLPFFSAAQSDTSQKRWGLRMGVYYNTGLNYYGRTDSLESAGTFPLVELWYKNRFYINAAPVFTINEMIGTSYAGTVTTAGYQKMTAKSITHIYLLKPFYRNNSGVVQSALKSQLSASYGRLTKAINANAGIDLKLSDRADFGANVGIDRILRKQLNKKLVIVADPSINVYAGTQRYSQNRMQKNQFLILPLPPAEVEEEVSKFNILSFEASVPLILLRGKWMILFTPAFVIPQNLVKVAGHPEWSEQGGPMFYLTSGIRVKL